MYPCNVSDGARSIGIGPDRTSPDETEPPGRSARPLQWPWEASRAERLTSACLDHPRLALAALAVATLLLGAGLPNVRAEYGYEILIGHDHFARAR